MSGSFTFELTEKDYTSFVLRGLRKTCFGVASAVALIVLFDFWVGGVLSGIEPSRLGISSGIGVAVVTAMILRFGWSNALRTFRETPSMRERHSVTFDEAGLRTVQHSGTFNILWADINRWDLDDHTLSLWLNRAMFVLIPRRALSESDVLAIGKLLEATELPQNKWRKQF